MFYRYLNLLVVIVCFPITASAQESFIAISGYGDSEKIARIDAKQQLALNIYSKVEVSEKTHQYHNQKSTLSSYEQTSQIDSLPVAIQNLSLAGVDCSSKPCRYDFTINKSEWAEKLSQDISNNHAKSEIGFTGEATEWRDLRRFWESQHLLEQSAEWLTVLSAVDFEQFNLLAPQQHLLELKSQEKQSQFRVTFLTSNDPFSAELNSILSNTSIASANGSISIYIKGTNRNGKQANKFIAKQTVSLKVFDTSSPTTAVSQKEVSETATSSKSAAHATKLAQQKIIKTLTNESLFSFLN
ncbi:hypothetical protein [Vibrio agarivorans]|uniref:hypothetical protein n=1 Tax=Vibrio agarivorans TaxID=153622 RepID=UPI00222E2FEF|nr:hypothetical protein [Vibrio agarivorans]MDN3660400.1 hypothetical protein [Vibrio agarivorans]